MFDTSTTIRRSALTLLVLGLATSLSCDRVKTADELRAQAEQPAAERESNAAQATQQAEVTPRHDQQDDELAFERFTRPLDAQENEPSDESQNASTVIHSEKTVIVPITLDSSEERSEPDEETTADSIDRRPRRSVRETQEPDATRSTRRSSTGLVSGSNPRQQSFVVGGSSLFISPGQNRATNSASPSIYNPRSNRAFSRVRQRSINPNDAPAIPNAGLAPQTVNPSGISPNSSPQIPRATPATPGSAPISPNSSPQIPR